MSRIEALLASVGGSSSSSSSSSSTRTRTVAMMLMLFPLVFLALYFFAPGYAGPVGGEGQALSEMPIIGFGTWGLDRSNISETIAFALKSGYVHLDCASAYNNEEEVGRGIRTALEQDTSLRREQLWITSKLWNDRHRPDMVLTAVKETLSDLGLTYLDNYLMHWPAAFSPEDGKLEDIDYVDTWRAMEELVDQGLVRHIGMSNFAPREMDRLLAAARIKPYNHQMELHPFLPQADWLKWHDDRHIKVTAYSPLANANPTYHGKNDETPRLLEMLEMQQIAEKHQATPAQIALAWGMKRGTAVIPKSSHPQRIRENLESSALVSALDQDDLTKLGRLALEHPTRFSDPSQDWGYTFFEGLLK